MKISLALATHNEEKNIRDCIESCLGLVDEIVIVDGSSTDRTVEIARRLGAHVITAQNNPMFHINKQRAMDGAKGEWILQLDADERVTPALREEIKKIVRMSGPELDAHQKNLKEAKLFERHQMLVQPFPTSEVRRGGYNAFFIPRLNYFLGTYLRHGGVYPDGAIRLIRRGKARLPCKDVHEIMEVEGKTGWLANPLNHIDSPDFARYLERNSRYIDRMAADMKNLNTKKNLSNFVDYMFLKPVSWFFMTAFRHKGILDGWQGIVFSFFSALRFPRAYARYISRTSP
jgi:glycosyltransferase involved in cell wall biosynthesis